MGTKTKTSKIPGKWSDLVKLWPLRPIRDKVNYDNVREIADDLTGRTDRNEDQTDYLESLSALIKTYENKNCPAEASNLMSNGQFRLIDVVDDMCAGKDVFFRLVRVAKDVMTKDVKTLTLDDKVETCLNFMKDNKVRHVPVIDPPTEEGAKPVFVGVVSGRDLSRLMSPYLEKVGEEETDRKALRQPLTQIVTRKPKSVSPDTPMADVIATMVKNRVDMVPVLADEDLVGIVTTGDILKLFVRLHKIHQLSEEEGKTRKRMRLVDLTSGEGPGDIAALFSSAFKTVEDILTEQPDCLQDRDDLAKAIKIMQDGKFRHVPIVNEKRGVVGIISDRNVLRHLPPPGGQQPVEAEAFRSNLFAVDPKDPSLSLRVTRIMASDVVHILPSCSFYDAVKTMHDARISCLVVVDEGENLRGIVTVTDVMRALLTAYELTKKSQAYTEPAQQSAAEPSQPSGGLKGQD